MTVSPAKTQISLDIHPVWSESWLWAQWVAKDPGFLHADSEDSDQTGQMLGTLCAQWVAKDPSFLHVDSEDSDQCGRMPRLIWVFTGAAQFSIFLHEKLCYWY